MHVEAHEPWDEHDQWVEDNTPVNENWSVQDALMKERRQKRKENRKKRREEYLTLLAKASHMSEQVVLDPSSPDYEQHKSDVDNVDLLVDKVTEAAEAEQARNQLHAEKAAREAASRDGEE